MSTAGSTVRRAPPGMVSLAALAVLFLALPVIALATRVSWADLWHDITSDEARAALRLSLVCSTASTVVVVLLGLPLAVVLARARFTGRSLVRALVILPMVLPPVVGGVALLAAFGRRGLVGSPLFDHLGVQVTFTTVAVVLAQAFVSLPFFVIAVEAGLRTLDPRIDEAAASLGASRWYAFRRVTLPLLGPAVAAGAALAWARALGEFGATITFAGNIAGRTRTAPLAVYLELDSRPQTAYALSLVLVVLCLAVLVALRGRWLSDTR